MRLKKILLFLLIFSINCFFSQQSVKSLLELSAKIYASNPDSSLRICKDAEKISTKKDVGDICLCKIKTYLLFTDYENAELEIHKALDFYKNKKDFTNLSKIYRLKWNLLNRIGESEKAHQNLLISYQLIENSRDYSTLFSILGNVSYAYINSNKLDSADFYFKKMKNLLSKVPDSKKYYFYQNQGIYFRLLGQYEQSSSNLQKAKNVAYTYNLLDSKATINNEMSKLYQLEKNYGFANKFALESYLISKKNKLIYEQADALKELIKIEQVQSNFRKALLYTNELMELQNQILNLEKLNNIKSVEQRLTLTKKENELTQKNLQIERFKVQTIRSKIKNQRQNLIIIIISFSLIFIFIIFYRTRKLNITIQHQKFEVEEKNKEITDSITYAKRIQSAILPSEKLIKTYFPSSFILYKPKDIVAGDFYWFEIIDNTVFFAVADCTGHGVPGAMVSVVCHNALNRSVKEYQLRKPSEILDKTREIVIAEFEKSDEDVKDGMDISLASLRIREGSRYEGNSQISLFTPTLSWSGAHNPCWIFRENGILEAKADKQPIGKYLDPKPFTNHEIEIKANDEIYMFTDGFQDQFGGVKGKKFMISKLRELILSLHQLPMEEKKIRMNQAFENWKGNLDQVDDVCVLGVRI